MPISEASSPGVPVHWLQLPSLCQPPSSCVPCPTHNATLEHLSCDDRRENLNAWPPRRETARWREGSLDLTIGTGSSICRGCSPTTCPAADEFRRMPNAVAIPDEEMFGDFVAFCNMVFVV
jgi:hypothetical protein